jgi:hypothetical protein
MCSYGALDNNVCQENFPALKSLQIIYTTSYVAV